MGPTGIGSNYAIIRDDAPSATTVSAFGDLDFDVASELQDAVLADSDTASAVVVDLSECRYMGAAIVSVLVRAHAALGERLAVIAPAGCAARRLLELVGLDKALALRELDSPSFLVAQAS